MAFTVTKVLGGDTFLVSPNWMWDNQEGDIVHPIGYSTPEEGQEGFQATKDKLSMLILGQAVEITNPVTITFGQLLCEVHFEGKNLASYFPEHQ